MSSFGGASKARGVSRAYTSLHLIGGIDIDASRRDQLLQQRLPDLKTEGGAVFGGSVAILGDMCVNGTMCGNLSGNVSGNLIGDISVEGDLNIGGNLTSMDGIISNLQSDIVCITGELLVDVISPKTGNIIDLGNVLIDNLIITGTIVGANISGNISNITSLSLQTLTANIVTANTVCVNGEILVDTIYPKTGSSVQFGNIVVNDITVNGTILGNVNIDIANVTSLTLQTVTANLVDANIVCIHDELQTNLIVPKTGNTIYVGANLEPTANAMFDFGSPTARWDNIYGNTIYTSYLDGLSPITAKTDFLPSADLQWNLGVVAQRWKTLCVGNIDNPGILSGNFLMGNNAVIQQNVAADVLIGNIVITDNITSTGNGIILEGVLALGSMLTANVMSANIGCFKEGQFNSIIAKGPSPDIGLYGNLIPGPFQNIYLGNSTNKIEKLYVYDIVVCGTLTGNVNVSANIGNTLVLNSLTSNIVCVTGELLVDVINEKTLDSGVTVDGVLHKDTNTIVNNVTSNIIEAKVLFDYTRTVVNTPTYTIVQTDDIIGVKATANTAVTLTLPQISTLIRKRKRYTIVDEAGYAGTNPITIMTSGSDKIFDGTSWMLGGDFNSVQIYSDEVDNWFAI